MSDVNDEKMEVSETKKEEKTDTGVKKADLLRAFNEKSKMLKALDKEYMSTREQLIGQLRLLKELIEGKEETK